MCELAVPSSLAKQETWQGLFFVCVPHKIFNVINQQKYTHLSQVVKMCSLKFGVKPFLPILAVLQLQLYQPSA
jgi:hypothetical protein